MRKKIAFKPHETRGQATGLITEQAERCRTWVSVSNHKFKPLLAFM